MRKAIVLFTFAGLLTLAARAVAGDDGCGETVRWWGQIEASGQRVDAELRSLFQEAAALGVPTGERVKTVDRLLRERYPGGSFVAGQSGRLVFGPNNYVEFSGQRTQTLVAKLDDVTRRYDLQQRRITIVYRGHSLRAEIRPADCRFVGPAALPPWMDQAAGAIVGRKGRASLAPFIELLNRVYERRLAATGIRLDQLAEAVLTDGETVRQVLDLGREVYGEMP